MKKRNDKIIILVLVLAFVMRLVAINQSFWLDEAIGVIAVKKYHFLQILTQFMKADNHPPLYYLTLDAWAAIFGYSEFAVRALTVGLGVFTVYLTYQIVRQIKPGNRFFQLISALFLATSQFHIYYSQEARMYSMAAFFAALCIYSFIKVIKNISNKKHTILFSVSLIGLVFTDYLPVFLLPVFIIVPYLQGKKRDWWKKYLLLYLPLFVLGVLWLPSFLFQVSRGRWLLETLPTWQGLAGGATFKQVVLLWMKFVGGRISFINKRLYYSCIVAISLPFIYLLWKAWLNKTNNLVFVWYWLVFPGVLGFIASLFFPAFIYFRFTFVIPAFYILIAHGVSSVKKSWQIYLASVVIAFNLVSWVIYISDFHQQREMWRQAVNFIESVAKEDEVVVFEFTQPFAAYLWYEKGNVEAVGVTDSISAHRTKTQEITRSVVQEKDGVYYFEYLQNISDPENYVRDVLSNEGFVVEKEYGQFWGVGKITYYSKLDN
jgi:mannosyltransferase